jgi:hypothetical protein
LIIMENLTDNEKTILQAVNANPGITPGQLGKRLGLDRNYARRVGDRLIGFGHLTKRESGQGFAFWPVNGGGSERVVFPNSETSIRGPEQPRPTQYDRPAYAGPINGNSVDVTDSRLAGKPPLALPAPGGQVDNRNLLMKPPVLILQFIGAGIRLIGCPRGPLIDEPRAVTAVGLKQTGHRKRDAVRMRQGAAVAAKQNRIGDLRRGNVGTSGGDTE